MSWHHGRMAAFDVETTGRDPRTARIVTAAVVLVGGGSETTTRRWVVDPGIEIPDEATAVHGITTERARSEGQPSSTAVAEIGAALTAALNSGFPIVTFNARYDLTVFDREARRHGQLPLTEQAGGEDLLRVIDPLVIDKAVDTYRRGSRTLAAACTHYRVDAGTAHDSTSDALAAARVAWRLAERYPRLQDVGLTELHALQAGWACTQARSLQTYLRRKDPQAVVETAWPLLPAEEG